MCKREMEEEEEQGRRERETDKECFISSWILNNLSLDFPSGLNTG